MMARIMLTPESCNSTDVKPSLRQSPCFLAMKKRPPTGERSFKWSVALICGLIVDLTSDLTDDLISDFNKLLQV
jgi:hypothetical protein